MVGFYHSISEERKLKAKKPLAKTHTRQGWGWRSLSTSQAALGLPAVNAWPVRCPHFSTIDKKLLLVTPLALMN
jgi:hypothetical protein